MIQKILIPKVSASLKEWAGFAAMAPRKVVVAVYNKINKKSEVDTEIAEIIKILEARIFSFDRVFAYFCADDIFSGVMEVKPRATNAEIKEQIKKEGVVFPCLIVEKNPLLSGGGWFRGIAISDKLVIAGVITEAIDYSKAAAVVKENNLLLLTPEDVEILNDGKMECVSELFRIFNTSINNRRYWLDAKIGADQVVWTIGNPCKFSGMPTENTRAAIIAKL